MTKPGTDDTLAKAVLEKERKEINFMRARLTADMEAFEVAKGRDYGIGEIGEGKGVEMVTEREFIDSAEAEAFMNELVKINVHTEGVPGSLPVVVVTVNGTNQPIIRGRDQYVKRKYVEALARSRITNYEQQVEDASKPEVIRMRDMTSLTYPFAVREDRNPRGARWLERILQQP